MSALRVEISPDNKPQVTRLAHREIEARVHTWETFVTVSLRADGSGHVVIRQPGRDTRTIEIEPEATR